MDYVKGIVVVMLLLNLSCANETQTKTEPQAKTQKSVKPKLIKEQLKFVNTYIEKLKAEEVKLQPPNVKRAADVLAVQIRNSEVVRIADNTELSNAACADTLATLLWNALAEKDKIEAIQIGFYQDEKGAAAKNKWVNYETKYFK